MPVRPYFKLGIEELERLFDQNREDHEILTELSSELTNRDTARPKKLQARVIQALGVLQKPVQSPRPSKPTAATPTTKATQPDAVDRAPLNPPERTSPQPTRTLETKPEPAPLPPRTPMNLSGMGEPERVMLAWTALEVLSPQTFLKPENLPRGKILSGGKIEHISRFENAPLAWENGPVKSIKDYRLYFDVVLGSIAMEPAVGALLTVFTDRREERPAARGDAIIATVTVDNKGCLIEEDAITLSSFGWALPIALTGDLKSLGDWQRVEMSLLEDFDRQIRKKDDKGNPFPLSRGDIDSAYQWLVARLALPAHLVRPPSFAIKAYQWFKIAEPPEPLLLNSFFLADLDKARQAFQSKTATLNLQRYVGQIVPSKRENLLVDKNVMKRALDPRKMPLGRWPSKSRHSLVALQQAAVNLAAQELKEEGILAVNGPPGTGKTTFLRDIVAHVVTERARVMATYDEPEDAFSKTGLVSGKGGAFLHFYKIDERLRGFELVVASSNNKAVENVSAELPVLGAVAHDALTGGYFKTVSDNLHKRETWGVISAVLGNAINRADFRREFWWSDDHGFFRYLQHAAGTPALITVEDGNNKKTQRLPLVVQNEKPPEDKDAALRRWKAAKRKFAEAEKAAKQILAVAARAANLPQMMEKLTADLYLQRDAAQGAKQELVTLASKLFNASATLDSSSETNRRATHAAFEIRKARPGFFSRLFNTADSQSWRYDSAIANKELAASEAVLTACRVECRQIKEKQQQTESVFRQLSNAIIEAETVLPRLNSEYADLRTQLGGQFIDDAYFEMDRQSKQLSIPWLDSASSRARDNLFEASMELHRAFIDASAQKLRNNLSLLMESFGVRSFGTPEKDAMIPNLWSCLFLVVPVVSTTFASVGRMFGRIGPDAFGWLLIDEAGQALPQAAVGALTRFKRAVVVGDPMQIEPVVMLPEQLTQSICREFSISESKFNAPAASTQTLCDAATAYIATFESKAGSREVGVPLLVHRRCADPMFSVSNAVAYDGLMVQAKAPKRSPIADILGPSTWYDIEGGNQDKWSPEEGDFVLTLLKKLKDEGCNPDLYIVTPFVVVQDSMRELVRKSGILTGWVERPDRWPFDRIGTVHTVQGREAEAVIFVLGAPSPRQTGARNWAGGRPNLLNVAVSRAQEVIYIVGNRKLWENAGLFSQLSSAFEPTPD